MSAAPERAAAELLVLGSRRQESRRRLLVAAGAGVLVHLGLGYAVWSSPKPDPDDPDRMARINVATFDKEVRLTKPQKPPDPPRPDPPKKVEPIRRERPKPLEDVKKLEKKEIAKAAPKRIPRAKKDGPQKKKPAEKGPKIRSPKTLVLPNLGGRSRMRVADGDEQVLGNPEVEVTPESSRNDDDGVPDGGGPSDEPAPAPAPAPEARPEPPPPPALRPPRVKRRLMGTYPAEAPRTGRPISLSLSIVVGVDGRVESARVVSKPPVAGDLFDEEALRVVRRTSFYPATRGGSPVAHRISYVVVFEP